MKQVTSSVVDHYTRNNLMERIRFALESAGHDPDNPTIEMLSELDHLHGGGFATTEAQVEVAEIPKGCHVLDAGCGGCKAPPPLLACCVGNGGEPRLEREGCSGACCLAP